MWVIKNWFQMIGYWVIAKLGIKLSTDPIPDGTPYCYVPDEERNNEKEPFTFYTKPCKYYKHLGGDWTGCGYTGEIMNFDTLHWDQCKICGEKDNYFDDEDAENQEVKN